MVRHGMCSTTETVGENPPNCIESMLSRAAGLFANCGVRVDGCLACERTAIGRGLLAPGGSMTERIIYCATTA